jgi:hypothetical protein
MTSVFKAEPKARAEVPDLSHLSYRDYNRVYEPSEDTYLFLDVAALPRRDVPCRATSPPFGADRTPSTREVSSISQCTEKQSLPLPPPIYFAGPVERC